MKTYLALAFGAALTLPFAPQLGAAPQFGRNNNRDRVCLYKDSNYVGDEQCYNVGDEIRSLGGGKDRVSSIRIYGRAYVTVYDQTDFKGRTTEFDTNVPDLARRAASGGHTWNDRIESLRVTSGGYTTGPTGTNSPPVYGRDQRYPDRYPNESISEGICVYDRADYQGRSECWNSGMAISDLGRNGGWNNRIGSIRVFGRARAILYRNADYRGESVVIDRDVPNLSQFGRNWNNQISSIQIEGGREFPGRGRGRGYGRGRQ